MSRWVYTLVELSILTHTLFTLPSVSSDSRESTEFVLCPLPSISSMMAAEVTSFGCGTLKSKGIPPWCTGATQSHTKE